MRLLRLVVSSLVLAGCSFDDAAPTEAEIHCTVSEQCPGGWRCAPRLGRCVQRSDTDVAGPTLVGAVAPALARPGETIVVTVTADEPVLGTPEIEVRTGTTARAVPRRDAEDWTFEVPPDEPDGLLTFFGSAEDAAGNGTRGVLLGAARVDGTAPAILATRVVPAIVTTSTGASVVVSLSEDVRPGARLLARTAGSVEVLRLELTETTSTLRFELALPQGVADGVLTLHVEGLVDLAGNQAPPTEVGSLTVDGTPPLVRPLGLANRRFSAQPGFDVVTVPVDVTGASLVQVCLAADCRDAAGLATVPFPVTAGAGGPRLVSVRARDVAGNTAEVVESVDFDFQPPHLESLDVEPATIAPGGQVLVTATFDEPLAAGAALVVAQDDGGWSDRLLTTRAGSRQASFIVRMPQASLPSATFQLRLEALADDVANASAPADAGSVLLDADPPVFLAQDAGVERRYSHQPGHDVVTLAPLAIDGAARVEVCLDSACVAADGGVVSFPVLPSASEGGHAVTWRAYDEVGNAAVRFDNVIFDFTPPRVLSANVGYTPPPGCPLTSVAALTNLGAATVSLTTDERLAALPQLDAGALLPFSPTSGSVGDQAFTFTTAAPANLASGGVAISGWLADDVGNAGLATVTVLDVDTTPPPPVVPAQEEGFVYTRAPFGAQGTNYQTRFTVAADAGTFEPGVFLQVWNSSSTSSGLILANLRADATGALPLSVIPPGDLLRVYFKQYDTACNAQPPTPTAAVVPRTEVVLTMGAKVAGETVFNPNRYFEEFGAGPALGFEAFRVEWGATELARADAVTAQSRSPMLRWQVPAPPLDGSACVVLHPTRKETLLLSGNRVYRRSGAGWIEEPPLPDVPSANCVAGSWREGRGVLAGTSGGFIGLPEFSSTWSIIPVFMGAGNGYLTTSSSGDLISVAAANGDFEVFRGDPDLSWRQVTMLNSLPPRELSAATFTSLDGQPVVVGDRYGMTDAWRLAEDFSTGAMQWEQLADAPAAPEVVTNLAGSWLVLVSASHATWIYQQSPAGWVAGPPCPLTAPIVSAYQDSDGSPSFLAADWSVAHFDGYTWTTLAPPAPATAGYRDLGHSIQHGTLATQGTPGRLVFHGSRPDGGLTATWSWDGGRWAQLPGTSPASPTGVAVAEVDGGLLLLGLEQGSTNFSTYRFRSDAWTKVGPANSTARTRHALALDRAGRVVVAGGITTTGQPLSAWSWWSGIGWAPLSPGFMAPRSELAMGYDPVRQVTVIFSGLSGTVSYRDTLEYTTTIAYRTTPDELVARAGAALVWDPTYQALVLVGGGLQDTWIYDGTWRNLTAYSGGPPGPGLAAWDPTTQAIMALTTRGEAFLAPYQPVAHRFVPELPGITSSDLLGGRVRAIYGPRAPPSMHYSAFLPSGWISLGAASSNATVVLDRPTAQQVALYGLRLGPETLDKAPFEVDYFEFVFRYR